MLREKLTSEADYFRQHFPLSRIPLQIFFVKPFFGFFWDYFLALANCWLLIIGCWLLVIGCLSFEATTFATGTRPASVAIGDLDGDGAADDLAVANFESDNVSVLLECFLTGTRLLTDKGEVAVEKLKIGDLVQTAEGELEPIKWIGRQTAEPNQVRNPLRGYPVLIKAGALGNNLPVRDLYVSPDHALLVEGLLINAGALVNDISILKTEPTSAFTHYHIELDKHALLLAEGTLAESYLPQKEDRLAYDNGAEYEQLYPSGNRMLLWPLDYPRVSSIFTVPGYIREHLLSIAGELGAMKEVA